MLLIVKFPLPVKLIPLITNAPVFCKKISPEELFVIDVLLICEVIGLLELIEPTPVFAVTFNVFAVTLVVAAVFPVIEPFVADKVTVFPDALTAPLAPNAIFPEVVEALILTPEVKT